MVRFQNKRLLLQFCALFILTVLISACSRTPRLLLVSPGHPDKRIELGSTQEFSLSFIHSVHKTPVFEYFTVQTDGTLLLTSTRYQSYGVGLPSLPEEGRLRLQDGWLILDNLHRPFTELQLRVGPEAKLSLQVAGTNYPLHQWYPAGSLIKIRKEI